MMSRPVWLALSLLLGSASAHTNAVGFVRVVNAGNTQIALTFVYGTYHPGSNNEGALALYGYSGSGDVTSAANYNTLLYGAGGTIFDATYAMGATSNVGNIDWSGSSRSYGASWTQPTLEAIGFTVGTNYLYDVANNVPLNSHQQATINIPCAASGTTARYRPDFDENPTGGVLGRSSLSFNYSPCTSQTSYAGCGDFDMTDLLIQVDSSCGVNVIGVSGVGPSNPPPPPLPNVPIGTPNLPPPPPAVAVTVTNANGVVETEERIAYTGDAAVPEGLTVGSSCCSRNEIGADLCPWEFECPCCAGENTWSGEPNPAPFWDPVVGQFAAAGPSAPCAGVGLAGIAAEALPTCPCCQHDDPDAGLEYRCPIEWRCPPPSQAALSPIIPGAAGVGILIFILLIYFRPRNKKLEGTVFDDTETPIAGALVTFKDSQAKCLCMTCKTFKESTTTDFRGKFTLKVRPAATGLLKVTMAGFIDDGLGSRHIKIPTKKSKTVLPVGYADLSLVTPRVLTGHVRSDNSVSKVTLPGATVEVTLMSTRSTRDSPRTSSEPRSPRSADNVSTSPQPQAPLMKRSGTENMSSRSLIKKAKADAQIGTVVASTITEDVPTSGTTNYKVDLLPGTYAIKYSAPGHEVHSETITLGETGHETEREIVLDVTLIPRVYTFSGKVLTAVTRKSEAVSPSPVASEQVVVTQSDAKDMFALADTSGDGLVDEEELLVLSTKLMTKRGKVVDEASIREFMLSKRTDPETPLALGFDAFALVYNDLVNKFFGATGSSWGRVRHNRRASHLVATLFCPTPGFETIPGATVLVFDDNGEEIKTLKSDANGFFILSLPAGMYTRRVMLDGYTTKFDHIEISADLTSDVHLEVITYDLIGTITSQSKASYHSEMPPPRPLARARVTLNDASGDAVKSAVTAEDGAYSLAAPGGNYTLEVTASGYESLSGRQVQLTADDQRADATLFEKLYKLSGTVVDADGDAPIPVASVELMEDDHKLVTSVLSGQDGTYKFMLPARDKHPWVRRVGMVGFVTDEKAHVLKVDYSEIVRLEKAQHMVTGVITGVDGAPLAGASIELHDASGALVASAFSDESGNYTMAAGHGEFTWSASADGYVANSKKLSVADDATADASLEPVVHKLTGVVTEEETNAKLGGVAVEITPEEPKEDEPKPPIEQKAASCVTNPDGSYAVEGILPGRYVITFNEEKHDPGRLEHVVDKGEAKADCKLTVTTYKVEGLVTSVEGDAIEYATVELLDKKGKATETTTNEEGKYTLTHMLPGEHKIKVTAAGFDMKKHAFTTAKEDVLAGGAADVTLDPQYFSLSGCVKSDSDASCPPIPGAVCWLKKHGKVKKRVVCDDKGVWSFGELPGGLYNVVAGAELHVKMRAVVNLDKDIKPGGEADLVLPKPLPPEADIGAALATLITPLKSIFQHYCSAAIVGEDNPFQMAFFQVEAYMADLKLPDGLSKTASKKVSQLFDDVNGPSRETFKINHKGEVTGALRMDPEKSPDRILTFDEFLDFQVRLAWLCGQRGLLSSRAFPFSRRGLGFALKLYVEEILMKRAHMLEVDPAFEEMLKKFKLPTNIAKSITKTFDEQSKGTKMITVDMWVAIIKKWRAIGTTMSIITTRMLYVQFADDDRGKVPLYVQDIQPGASTLKADSGVVFEEEEDDDVMEAKLAAAQAAKAAEKTEEPEEKKEVDALTSLEQIRKPRAADQEMTITEMKAAVCRLAYLLCKGKTLADRVECFASMYIK